MQFILGILNSFFLLWKLWTQQCNFYFSKQEKEKINLQIILNLKGLGGYRYRIKKNEEGLANKEKNLHGFWEKLEIF